MADNKTPGDWLDRMLKNGGYKDGLGGDVRNKGVGDLTSKSYKESGVPEGKNQVYSAEQQVLDNERLRLEQGRGLGNLRNEDGSFVSNQVKRVGEYLGDKSGMSLAKQKMMESQVGQKISGAKKNLDEVSNKISGAADKLDKARQVMDDPQKAVKDEIATRARKEIQKQALRVASAAFRNIATAIRVLGAWTSSALWALLSFLGPFLLGALVIILIIIIIISLISRIVETGLDEGGLAVSPNSCVKSTLENTYSQFAAATSEGEYNQSLSDSEVSQNIEDDYKLFAQLAISTALGLMLDNEPTTSPLENFTIPVPPGTPGVVEDWIVDASRKELVDSLDVFTDEAKVFLREKFNNHYKSAEVNVQVSAVSGGGVFYFPVGVFASGQDLVKLKDVVPVLRSQKIPAPERVSLYEKWDDPADSILGVGAIDFFKNIIKNLEDLRNELLDFSNDDINPQLEYAEDNYLTNNKLVNKFELKIYPQVDVNIYGSNNIADVVNNALQAIPLVGGFLSGVFTFVNNIFKSGTSGAANFLLRNIASLSIKKLTYSDTYYELKTMRNKSLAWIQASIDGDEKFFYSALNNDNEDINNTMKWYSDLFGSKSSQGGDTDTNFSNDGFEADGVLGEIQQDIANMTGSSTSGGQMLGYFNPANISQPSAVDQQFYSGAPTPIPNDDYVGNVDADGGYWIAISEGVISNPPGSVPYPTDVFRVFDKLVWDNANSEYKYEARNPVPGVESLARFRGEIVDTDPNDGDLYLNRDDYIAGVANMEVGDYYLMSENIPESQLSFELYIDGVVEESVSLGSYLVNLSPGLTPFEPFSVVNSYDLQSSSSAGVSNQEVIDYVNEKFYDESGASSIAQKQHEDVTAEVGLVSFSTLLAEITQTIKQQGNGNRFIPGGFIDIGVVLGVLVAPPYFEIDKVGVRGEVAPVNKTVKNAPGGQEMFNFYNTVTSGLMSLMSDIPDLSSLQSNVDGLTDQRDALVLRGDPVNGVAADIIKATEDVNTANGALTAAVAAATTTPPTDAEQAVIDSAQQVLDAAKNTLKSFQDERDGLAGSLSDLEEKLQDSKNELQAEQDALSQNKTTWETQIIKPLLEGWVADGRFDNLAVNGGLSSANNPIHDVDVSSWDNITAEDVEIMFLTHKDLKIKKPLLFPMYWYGVDSDRESLQELAKSMEKYTKACEAGVFDLINSDSGGVNNNYLGAGACRPWDRGEDEELDTYKEFVSSLLEKGVISHDGVDSAGAVVSAAAGVQKKLEGQYYDAMITAEVANQLTPYKRSEAAVYERGLGGYQQLDSFTEQVAAFAVATARHDTEDYTKFVEFEYNPNFVVSLSDDPGEVVTSLLNSLGGAAFDTAADFLTNSPGKAVMSFLVGLSEAQLETSGGGFSVGGFAGGFGVEAVSVVAKVLLDAVPANSFINLSQLEGLDLVLEVANAEQKSGLGAAGVLAVPFYMLDDGRYNEPYRPSSATGRVYFGRGFVNKALRGEQLYKKFRDVSRTAGTSTEDIYLKPESIGFINQNGEQELGDPTLNTFILVRGLINGDFTGESVYDMYDRDGGDLVVPVEQWRERLVIPGEVESEVGEAAKPYMDSYRSALGYVSSLGDDLQGVLSVCGGRFGQVAPPIRSSGACITGNLMESIYPGGKEHLGMDISGVDNAKTVFYPIMNGTVKRYLSGDNNVIEIHSEDGWVIRYLHGTGDGNGVESLPAIPLETRVNTDTPLAYVSNVSDANIGAHLHIDIRKFPVDANGVVQKDEGPVLPYVNPTYAFYLNTPFVNVFPLTQAEMSADSELSSFVGQYELGYPICNASNNEWVKSTRHTIINYKTPEGTSCVPYVRYFDFSQLPKAISPTVIPGFCDFSPGLPTFPTATIDVDHAYTTCNIKNCDRHLNN